MAITTEDLNQLIREPSPKVRAHIAAKVSANFNRSNFTSNENKLAIDIFRLLLRDTSISVRRAIAENLKNNMQVPRDIVLALSADALEIAMPVIECSKLLTDDDLIELIGASQELRRCLAITRREKVSRRVSTALLATHNEEIVVSLLGNPGAALEEDDFDSILSEFRYTEDVLEALVCRGGLSIRFAEKLYSLVSSQMKKHLTRRHYLPRGIIGAQLDEHRESAILRFLSSCMESGDLMNLAVAMHRGRRLNDRFIMRTLAAGEIEFFEAALATRAGIALSNVRKLSYGGALGFRTLCLSADLPHDAVEALAIVFQFWQKEHTLIGTTGKKEARLLEFLRVNGYDQNIAYMQELIELVGLKTHEPRILH